MTLAASPEEAPDAASAPFWRPVLAGAVANFAGVGIGRFAYTPLVPALVAAGWATPAEAGYAGAANLAGYLLGALLSLGPLGGRPAGSAVRTALGISVAGTLACALPLGFAWLASWRFAVGVAGAVLMIVGTSASLARVAPGRRGFGAGIVFTGVGIGVALSSLVVPLLAGTGLGATWIALGLSLALGAGLTWNAWRAEPVPPAVGRLVLGLRERVVAGAVLFVYGADTLGWVPHTIYWIDFVARDLGLGLGTGAAYWSLFAIGALAGPMLVGAIASRTGPGPALVGATLIKLAAVALPGLHPTAPVLAFSSLVVGALAPGTATLVSARLAILLPPEALRLAWARATVVFALAQTVGGFAFARLHQATGSAEPLFAAGAACIVFAAIAAALVARRR